eukprot:12161881-Alexandrium_andersonii.AAC.1
MAEFEKDLPRDPKCAGLLQVLARGATWTELRAHEAGYSSSPLCPRCGEEAEDEWHRLWRCP